MCFSSLFLHGSRYVRSLLPGSGSGTRFWSLVLRSGPTFWFLTKEDHHEVEDNELHKSRLEGLRMFKVMFVFQI